MSYVSNRKPVAPSDESWKSQGFLNFYLPSKNGGRRKLGAIGLKEAKPNDQALLEWLNEDPSRIAILLAKLEVEYQAADSTTDSGFDL